MDWVNFVKDFVSEIDYDTAKQLEPETAECPDEAEDFLADLVDKAEELYEKYKGGSH